ncbi:hypothetical protein MMC18_001346 [Xylographa bjoerkii]|nr:hypothetical protein [Xylographa bjoerkii]
MGTIKTAIPAFVTPAPRISNKELEKRATQVNCGYINGDPNNASSSGPTLAAGNGGGDSSVSGSSASSASEAGTTTPKATSRPAEIGAIVGAICGAMVLLVLGAFMVRRTSRRRRTKLVDPTQAERDDPYQAELSAREGTQEISTEEVRPELEEVERIHELVGDNREELNWQELKGHEFSQELEVPLAKRQ